VWLANYGASSPVKSANILLPVLTYGRSRLPEWLDTKHLRRFASQCSKNLNYHTEDLVALFEKTYCSFVELDKPQFEHLRGKNAFGVYFVVEQELDIHQYLADTFPKETIGCRSYAQLSDWSKARIRDLANFVELVLHAGMEEPFSEYTGQGYSYRMLMPIYSYRHCHDNSPQDLCVIREHLVILGKLWALRIHPLDISSCSQLSRVGSDDLPEKTMRLDDFAAWSEAALTPTRILPTVESLHEKGRDLLKLMPDYKPLSEQKKDDVVSLLENLSAIHQKALLVVPEGEKYRREEFVRDQLRKGFVERIRGLADRMSSGQCLKDDEYPAFVLCGPSGSGKDTLLDDLHAFLCREGLSYDDPRLNLNCNLETRASFKEKIEALKKDVRQTREGNIGVVGANAGTEQGRSPIAFVRFNEIQAVPDFQEFISQTFSLADIYTETGLPVIVGCITHESEQRIWAKVDQQKKDVSDFKKRFEGFTVSVPKSTLRDLLILATWRICQEALPHFTISKLCLAYVLLNDVRLPSHTTARRFFNPFLPAIRQMSAVPITLENLQVERTSFLSRFPELSQFTRETEHLVKIDCDAI